MKTFLAVYRGETVPEARLITVTADPEIISYVCGQLLTQMAVSDDPVLSKVENGRKSALKIIRKEVKAEKSLPEIIRIIEDELKIADVNSEEEKPPSNRS